VWPRSDVHVAKRKREEDREKKDKINSGINKYFTAKAATSGPKPKVRLVLNTVSAG
jgi:hypothetical protein